MSGGRPVDDDQCHALLIRSPSKTAPTSTPASIRLGLDMDLLPPKHGPPPPGSAAPGSVPAPFDFINIPLSAPPRRTTARSSSRMCRPPQARLSPSAVTATCQAAEEEDKYKDIADPARAIQLLEAALAAPELDEALTPSEGGRRASAGAGAGEARAREAGGVPCADWFHEQV
ncbi:hypothetical protein FIBSPDRAFT_962802 [Athelia psychrophila]|uniref:Uncharacterized protein n=1 Tax=Athelia psychrophila TaxID=1759441 RepID=A0A165ZQD2_9AGAM|nr:hypothetical protein FIBSPDRAFT_962802 [Fibularhizoctonia sp. CBS 109695]